MSEKFQRLSFSRDWRSASDFPTYEENETIVRADLQALHEETKTYINETLLPGIESMAVPGTGDMKMSVYDREGKMEDVYRYAEEQRRQAEENAGAALEEHAQALPHVDAYSKGESISAATREALGLAEDATPDAALAKIAATPDIVMDVHTGKKYTVKAAARSFGVKRTGALDEAVSSSLNLTAVPGRLFRWGDRALFQGSYVADEYSSGWTAETALLDAKTGTLVRDTGTVGAQSVPGAFRVLSTDGALAFGTAVVDLKHPEAGVLYSGSLDYWNNQRYWGAVSLGSDYKNVYWYERGSKGSYAGSLTLTFGNTGNTSWIGSQVHVDETYLYILYSDGDQKMSLGRVNLIEKTWASALYSYDLSELAPVSPAQCRVYPALTTDKCVWLGLAWYSQTLEGNSYVQRYYGTNKTMRLDLETWALEKGDLTAEDFTAESHSSNNTFSNALWSQRGGIYIGTVGRAAYFWQGNYIYEMDQETGQVSSYTVELSDTNAKCGSQYPVVFDIPELPGRIVCGTALFDTGTGELREIVGGVVRTVDTAGRISATEITSRNGVWFGGTVTDVETMGLYDKNTLIGGTVTWGVEALEEYVEPEEDTGENGEEA